MQMQKILGTVMNSLSIYARPLKPMFWQWNIRAMECTSARNLVKRRCLKMREWWYNIWSTLWISKNRTSW